MYEEYDLLLCINNKRQLYDGYIESSFISPIFQLCYHDRSYAVYRLLDNDKRDDIALSSS